MKTESVSILFCTAFFFSFSAACTLCSFLLFWLLLLLEIFLKYLVIFGSLYFGMSLKGGLEVLCTWAGIVVWWTSQ